MTDERRSRRAARRRPAILLAVIFGVASPAAHAAEFALASDQVLVGAAGEYVTRDEDTLLDVARKNDLGYGQLIAVNPGIDPWLPRAGQRIVLPTLYLLPDGERRGIVINLAEHRLYFFVPEDATVETYPIGIGVEADMTPLGTTQVIGKDVQPSWYPPPSIRAERPELPEVVPPGPDNPLGQFSLRLGWTNYRIHGTNKPYGVGRHVSHGCIRLYPEDIAQLFPKVAVGTPVRVIEEPIRLAWVENELYLAVAPSRRQLDQIAIDEPVTPDVPYDLVDRVVAAAGNQVRRVDWHLVGQIGLKRPGMPVRITMPSPPPDDSLDVTAPSETSGHPVAALPVAGWTVNLAGGCGPSY